MYKEEYFGCECHSSDHVVRFLVEQDLRDWPPELFLEVQLHQWRPFWKRWWVALKYALGYQCRYGHWDCTTLKHEDVPRFRQMLDRYDELVEKFQESAQQKEAERKQGQG